MNSPTHSIVNGKRVELTDQEKEEIIAGWAAADREASATREASAKRDARRNFLRQRIEAGAATMAEVLEVLKLVDW